MKLRWERKVLKLSTPFRTAHEMTCQRENVIVHAGEGIGEGAVVPYHGETVERLEAYLSALARVDLDAEDIVSVVSRLPPGSAAARAACDIALHDHWARSVGQPLYRLLGSNADQIPLTSYTLGMDEPAVMAARAIEVNLPILKLKLGDQRDGLRVSSVRRAVGSTLRVDANASWSLDHARRMLPILYEHGVELLEQPLPVSDLAGLEALRDIFPRPPIFVDESITSIESIHQHAQLVDGIVVKLAKSGGIRGALTQIALARQLGLGVMLSCMVETSIAVTAAAHIAALADFVDLDTPLLINNDSFSGLHYDGARIVLPVGAGLGVQSSRLGRDFQR